MFVRMDDNFCLISLLIYCLRVSLSPIRTEVALMLLLFVVINLLTKLAKVKLSLMIVFIGGLFNTIAMKTWVPCTTHNS